MSPPPRADRGPGRPFHKVLRQEYRPHGHATVGARPQEAIDGEAEPGPFSERLIDRGSDCLGGIGGEGRRIVVRRSPEKRRGPCRAIVGKEAVIVVALSRPGRALEGGDEALHARPVEVEDLLDYRPILDRAVELQGRGAVQGSYGEVHPPPQHAQGEAQVEGLLGEAEVIHVIDSRGRVDDTYRRVAEGGVEGLPGKNGDERDAGVPCLSRARERRVWGKPREGDDENPGQMSRFPGGPSRSCLRPVLSVFDRLGPFP